MTQSTTMINACDAAVWLDDHGGTPKDLSGSSNEVNMKFDTEVGESKTFGTAWKARIVCGADGEFTLIISYSTAADEAADLLRDWFFLWRKDKRTLSVYLPDKNVGADVYRGEFVLKSLSIPAKSNDPNPIMATAVLLPSGAIDVLTNAT